jgi:prolyl-tRNA synthetase
MFLRTTEFLWQEGHTAHADADDAMAETMSALDFYRDTALQAAAMPVVQGEKTAGERFAGAQRTFTIEGMMRDGRALQAGTSHFMGTNFAKAFDIRFTGADDTLQLCHTTSWGLSSRLIGGLIMTHGDDRGLVMPPALAPYQVVIVPIDRGDTTGVVAAAVADLADRLRRTGVRVHVDDRAHVSPGFKFNEWELRGVPLRLELGPRDLAAGHVTMARRLAADGSSDRAKEQVSLDSAPARLSFELTAFQEMLLQRATRFREDRTIPVQTWGAFAEAVATGWALALACDDSACEDEIKAETTATPRCVPLDGEPDSGPCIRCGRPSAYGKRVLFGRSY